MGDLSTPSPASTSDYPRLITFYSLPDTPDVFSTLLSCNQEFVSAMIQGMLTKAREFDEIKAQKLRVEVELEQAQHKAENRVRSMKGQLDAAVKEAQELRQKGSQYGKFQVSRFPSSRCSRIGWFATTRQGDGKMLTKMAR